MTKRTMLIVTLVAFVATGTFLLRAVPGPPAVSVLRKRAR